MKNRPPQFKATVLVHLNIDLLVESADADEAASYAQRVAELLLRDAADHVPELRDSVVLAETIDVVAEAQQSKR